MQRNLAVTQESWNRSAILKIILAVVFGEPDVAHQRRQSFDACFGPLVDGSGRSVYRSENVRATSSGQEPAFGVDVSVTRKLDACCDFSGSFTWC